MRGIGIRDKIPTTTHSRGLSACVWKIGWRTGTQMTRHCKKRAPESEHFTDKELKRHILDVDKRRARYYQFFTGQTWGDRLNYDLCINTSNYDIKELVHAIAHLVEA